jgi:uncharacterized Zn finger protein
MAPQLQSTITCPKCGYQATEIMPTDACVAFYDCNGCGETLKDVAVFTVRTARCRVHQFKRV